MLLRCVVVVVSMVVSIGPLANIETHSRYFPPCLAHNNQCCTVQCSGGKSWVLAFMWLFFDTYHPPTVNTTAVHTLMARALPDSCGLPQLDILEWFKEHDKELKVQIWSQNSPDLNQVENPCDALEQVRSIEAPPRNPQDPNQPQH